ncbi:hypothetical protein ACIPJG_34020 [Streptomyces halstedii]|uniref:hypothetical protein n=1 Tax=Streptomyces halstedii TaxID=1944 RepID=UPI00380B2A14
MDLCQLCDQPDTISGMLCSACTKSTLRYLADLPALYEELGAHLAPSMAAGHGRSSKGGPAPLPVREHVLDLRAAGGIVGVLEDWEAAVRAERGMTRPVTPGRVAQRITRAVRALTGHMPWIVREWSQAGEFATEIRALTRDVRSIVAPAVDTVRGTRVGHCPAVHEDETICGAVLRLGHGERVVTCSWCGITYPPAMWAGLKTLIDADARAAA